MKKNKILLHFDELTPKSSAVALRGKYLIEQLRKDFIDHDLVVTTKSFESDISDISLKTLKSFNENKSQLILRVLSEVIIGFQVVYFQLKENPKISIFSSPGYITMLMASLSCILFKKKFIIDVRDIYPDVYIHSNILKPSSIFYRLLSRLTLFIYRKASFITVVTSSMKKLLLKEKIKSKLIYNGFPKRLSKIKNQKYKKFSIIFHGTIGMYQDVDLMIWLNQNLDKKLYDFYLIGEGKKVEQIKNIAGLKFLRINNYDEIISIVSKCHMGISFRTDDPISEYAFPVKVWEYIGLNMPTIIVPKSEAGDFVEKLNIGKSFMHSEKSKIIEHIDTIRKTYKTTIHRSDMIYNFSREEQAKKFSKYLSEALN